MRLRRAKTLLNTITIANGPIVRNNHSEITNLETSWCQEVAEGIAESNTGYHTRQSNRKTIRRFTVLLPKKSKRFSAKATKEPRIMAISIAPVATVAELSSAALIGSDSNAMVHHFREILQWARRKPVAR